MSDIPRHPLISPGDQSEKKSSPRVGFLLTLYDFSIAQNAVQWNISSPESPMFITCTPINHRRINIASRSLPGHFFSPLDRRGGMSIGSIIFLKQMIRL
jgi:hypothetical protein